MKPIEYVVIIAACALVAFTAVYNVIRIKKRKNCCSGGGKSVGSSCGGSCGGGSGCAGSCGGSCCNAGNDDKGTRGE